MPDNRKAQIPVANLERRASTKHKQKKGISLQSERSIIKWKVHFSSTPEITFEAAPEVDGVITFRKLNQEPSSGRILPRREPSIFKLERYGQVVEFSPLGDGRGGTDLSLAATDVEEDSRVEIVAGWVSVPMAMRAAVDHNINLRNHDESRVRGSGFLDN